MRRQVRSSGGWSGCESGRGCPTAARDRTGSPRCSVRVGMPVLPERPGGPRQVRKKPSRRTNTPARKPGTRCGISSSSPTRDGRPALIGSTRCRSPSASRHSLTSEAGDRGGPSRRRLGHPVRIVGASSEAKIDATAKLIDRSCSATVQKSAAIVAETEQTLPAGFRDYIGGTVDGKKGRSLEGF